jgi:short-subunit dehydrogenase
MEIAGSRILLTGATGGLGRAIAKALHDKGAHLLLTGRSQDALEALAAELHGRADALAADLAKREDVAALPGRAGQVDILVHNAGLPGSGRLESFTEDQIDRVLDVNLRAGIMLTHALLPGMTERGRGHLVYVSSMSGKIPTVRASVYSATKYGLRGFAGALSDDLQGSNVGTSVVFPGPIRDGGMWKDAGVELPNWVPKRYPHQVGAAVVKGIETGKPEIDVADVTQKFGAVMAAVAPRFAARVRGMLPIEDLAEQTAEAQRSKR